MGAGLGPEIKISWGLKNPQVRKQTISMLSFCASYCEVSGVVD